MKRNRLLGAAMAIACLASCTSAGPFVTNISSDGRGNLVVEKNTVHMNAFMGTVSLGDNPTTYTIRVVTEQPEKPPAGK